MLLSYFVEKQAKETSEETDFDTANVISELFMELNLFHLNKVFIENLSDLFALRKVKGLWMKVNDNKLSTRRTQRELNKMRRVPGFRSRLETYPIDIIFKYIKSVIYESLV